MNTQFHQREFMQMMYNPLTIPEGGDVLKIYKDLNKYKELRVNLGENIDNNKLMLYIFCMYDLHSPYRKKFTDVLKRKIEVAHDVGFPMNEEGIFDPDVEDFLKGKNERVNKKIVTYVRIHRNLKYSYLVTLEASYYGMMSDVMGGDKSKVKLIKEAQQELEETMIEVLNQDNNTAVKSELLRYMEDERLGLRPEDIAQKMREGKKPV